MSASKRAPASFYAFLTRRNVLLALLGVTLASAACRLVAAEGIHWVKSDTNSFLSVLAMVEGGALFEDGFEVGGSVPIRLNNPFYSVLIMVGRLFTSDWLAAAHLASITPSILTPPLLSVATWYADRRRFWPGLLAGLLAAFSWPFILIGVSALSNAPFIFFTAFALLSGLAFLRRQTLGRALLAGVAAGLAWATRGEGLFYSVAVLCPLALGAWRARRLTTRPVLKGAALFLIAFVIVGRGPTLVLGQFVPEGIKPARPYLKNALVDGARFANDVDRDDYRYLVSEDATALRQEADIRRLSWAEVIEEQGVSIVRASAENMKTNLAETLPRAFEPFFLLFLPLAVGILCFWRTRPFEESLMLAFFALPFVAIVPLIQLHNRYVFPITAVAFLFTGIGLAQMAGLHDEKQLSSASQRVVGERGDTGGHPWWSDATLKWRAAQALAVLLAVVWVGYGAAASLQLSQSSDYARKYRDASQWIKEQHGENPDFAVASNYHGVYAYLRSKKAALPSDSLGPTVRFLRNLDTRYITFGKAEGGTNRHLKDALESGALGGDDTITVEGTRLRVARTFEDGGGTVYLIELVPAEEQDAP